MLLVNLRNNNDDGNKRIKKSIIRLNKRHHCTTNIAYRVSMIGESRLANLLAITYLHGKVSSR